MAWDFSTEPEFQAQLDWMRDLVREEVWPLETVFDELGEDGFRRAIAPLQDYIARNLESTRRAVKAGVRIGMGSDAVFSMFGENTRELEWFVKAGMTPAQALATATTVAADLLDQRERLGRIAPGFAADLVAIEGTPLQNVSDVINGVRWVMKDGAVVVDRTKG